MNYSFDHLVEAYKNLGLKEGDIISLKTGLRSLGVMNEDRSRSLQLHLAAIDKAINLEKGTIVVATTSTNLCNTSTPFSLSNTEGSMGALPEFIRKHKHSVRSYHAFESYAALGFLSNELMSNTSRHSYGVETPEDRMIQSNAKCISIGLPSNITCSIIHQLEAYFNVPYRYVKEYHHLVKTASGRVVTDIFYRHPWYLSADISKSYAKFFNLLEDEGFSINRAFVGSGTIECYSMESFMALGKRVLMKDIYAILDHPPVHRPWKK